MGRSIGLAKSFFSGVRVAGQLVYVTANNINGVQQDQKVTIPVYRNYLVNGEERSDNFNFTVWGKLADVCCKRLSPGMALDIDCEPRPYMGKLFDKNGNLRLDNTGQAIEVQKTAYKINQIIFGEESEKFIAGDIQKGNRPIEWRNANHPNTIAWKAHLATSKGVSWDGSSKIFGFARVVITKGATPGQDKPARSTEGATWSPGGNNIQQQIKDTLPAETTDPQQAIIAAAIATALAAQKTTEAITADPDELEVF